MRIGMLKRLLSALIIPAFCWSAVPVFAGPVDVALEPAPQESSKTCQSYSMALAMTFHPASPFKADTPTELRELERRLRAALKASADSHQRAEPVREDWKAAMEAVSNGQLSIAWKDFAHLDPAMRFVASQTGISNAASLGATLSVALVKTPVMLSFTRIGTSSYATSHIVTIFGIDLPNASMTDSAKPKLLLVNSAVKYAGNVKNICAEGDLSDKDKYRAMATLSNDYDFRLFFPNPYLVTYVVTK